MKSYGQYCAVARASEILAERWTPIIVRNMSMGCRTFNEILAGAAGLSKALLVDRLKTLERAGVIEVIKDGTSRGPVYLLTESGEELVEVVRALGTWGARWVGVEPHHLDPVPVLWAKTRLWEPSRVPRDRVVIRFDIEDHKWPLWILADQSGAEVCVKHPGFEEDVVVTTDRETLTMWHMGRLSLRSARAQGRFKMEGNRELVRTFENWVPLSVFADVAPAAG